MMRASAMCVPRVLQFVGRGSGRHRGQRGLTTVEMVVALAVFSLAGLAMAGTMILYGRAAKGLTARTRMEEKARRLVQVLEFEAAEAQSLAVLESGAVLQFMRPDNSLRQFAFVDTDSNANTIGDNHIVERVTIGSDTGATNRLPLCSRVTSGGVTLPVFQRDTAADRMLVNMILRVGDRSPDRASTQRNQDDRETGPGYQSFVINTSLTPGAN